MSRVFVVAGIVCTIAALAFPPWRFTTPVSSEFIGYSFLASPATKQVYVAASGWGPAQTYLHTANSVDVTLLIIEIAIVGLIAIGGALVFRKPK